MTLSARAHGNSQPRWLFPFVVTVVFLLSALPLGRLAYTGIVSALNGNIWTLLSSSALWDAVFNTVITSFFGMIISLVIGGAFALAITLSDVRCKSILSFLFMLPMMIPPQVTALSWIGMTGPSSTILKAIGLAPPLGSAQPLYSLSGIALLLGVQHAPLVYLALRSGLLALPHDGVEAAKLSGASSWRVLKDIILPLSIPGFIAGAAIAFVSGVGNFGIPAILGIPASIYTLPTLIYSRFASFGTSTFGDIALLSTMIALISIIGLAIQERALKGRDYRIIGLTGKIATFRLQSWRLCVELCLWLVIVCVLVAPLLALVASSLAPAYGVPLNLDTATLHAYVEVIFRQSITRTAFINSLFLAAATSIGLLFITILTAYFLVRSKSKFIFALKALVDIPYALPGVVIAVAYVLLFAAPIPFLGVTLYGTIWIILLAYLSSFFAVSLKPMVSAFTQFDLSLEEAARLSGAGFWRRMKDVVLPLVGPAAGASVILVFLIACNELTVSALLWSAGTQTLGVVIYNLDDSGSFNLASALSVLVVAMVIILMLILEILGRYMPKGVVPWRN